MLASLDHKTCDECRSRAIYCDGTQPFCLNNETMNPKQNDEMDEQSESEEEDDENRNIRSRSRRATQRKAPHKAKTAEEESDPSPNFQPTSNDMILSLRDEQYSSVMFKAFRKLGAKRESERDKDLERQTKLDVFNYFKDSGVRMVKHINYRKPDLGLMEADDTYARDSKWDEILF